MFPVFLFSNYLFIFPKRNRSARENIFLVWWNHLVTSFCPPMPSPPSPIYPTQPTNQPAFPGTLFPLSSPPCCFYYTPNDGKGRELLMAQGRFPSPSLFFAIIPLIFPFLSPRTHTGERASFSCVCTMLVQSPPIHPTACERTKKVA